MNTNQQYDWNPDHYLQFRHERTQPSIDLVSKITIDYSPGYIIDLGCGPGNSSQVLLQRWPEAKLTGVDNSPAMIEKAKTDYPGQTWILADIAGFKTDIQFNIIFSNATIQWIPDHARLFGQWVKMSAAGGVIAIQLPQFRQMPIGGIIHAVSQAARWKKMTEDCAGLFTYHDACYYYELLAGKMKRLDMWETDYIHIMPSHASIIDWIKSTGLKPYLDRIAGDAAKKDFAAEILAEVRTAYPAQSNGSVLFPFKRLFFIGYAN